VDADAAVRLPGALLYSILVEEFAQRCVALGRFPGIWMCDADFVFDLI
jgi:hypothetical protein